MGIVDAQLTFSEAQDLSQVAALYGSTSNWDSGPLFTGNTGRDIGTGDPLVVYIVCDDTFVGATATLTINLVSDAAQGGQDASSNIHWTSGLLDVDTPSHGLTEGDVIQFNFPMDGGLNPAVLQYIAFTYTIATATTTGGTLSTYITRGAAVQKAFSTGMRFS